MPLKTLGQFALPVSNVDLSEAFYGEALGLPKLFRYGDLAFFDCSGVRLMLEGSQSAIQSSEGVCHYFMVDDIEAMVSQLESRGVTFEGAPHRVGSHEFDERQRVVEWLRRLPGCATAIRLGRRRWVRASLDLAVLRFRPGAVGLGALLGLTPVLALAGKP